MRRAARPVFLLAGLAVASVGAPRVARADLVVDADSKASFWAPDGWSASAQKRGDWTLSLRRAPDDKAMCGLAVSKGTGTLVASLEGIEAVWKQGPERYERVSKTDGIVGGAAGLRVEHRIVADGRTLRAFTGVVAAGEWRIAIWAAYEAGLDTGYSPIVRRIHESLVLPAAAPTPTGPSVPPTSVPPATSGTPQGAGLLFDPRFREGRASDVLLAGDAPLLRGTVDAFVDLVEASADATLLEAEEQALRDGIETAWRKAPPEDRAVVEGATAQRDRARAALARGDAADARAAVAAFTDAVFARAASSPSGGWQAPARACAARALETFSAPEPRVSVAAVDALEELFAFYTCVARNDGARPTSGQRAAVRLEKLRPALDTAGPDARRRVASARRLWSFVRARWDSADEATKLRIRWDATDLVRAIAKLPEVPADVRADGLAGYARAASAAVEALPVFDTYTNVVANADRVIVALFAGFGVAKESIDATVLGTDPLTLR